MNEDLEEFYLLGYNTLSSIRINQHFGGSCCPHLQSLWISQGRNQLALLTACFALILISKTSIDSQWTICHSVPEERTLPGHLCENVKSYKWRTYSLLHLCLTWSDCGWCHILGCAQPPQMLAIEILKNGSLGRASVWVEKANKRRHADILLLDLLWVLRVLLLSIKTSMKEYFW